MPLVPLNGKLLIRRLVESQTSSGIYLPEPKDSSLDGREGEVVAISPVCEDFEVGDRVIYHATAGEELNMKNVLIIKEENIIARIEH